MFLIILLSLASASEFHWLSSKDVNYTKWTGVGELDLPTICNNDCNCVSNVTAQNCPVQNQTYMWFYADYLIEGFQAVLWTSPVLIQEYVNGHVDLELQVDTFTNSTQMSSLLMYIGKDVVFDITEHEYPYPVCVRYPVKDLYINLLKPEIWYMFDDNPEMYSNSLYIYSLDIHLQWE